MWSQAKDPVRTAHGVLLRLTDGDAELREQMYRDWRDDVDGYAEGTPYRDDAAWNLVKKYNLLIAGKRLEKATKILETVRRGVDDPGVADKVRFIDHSQLLLAERIQLSRSWTSSEEARSICEESESLLERTRNLLDDPRCWDVKRKLANTEHHVQSGSDVPHVAQSAKPAHPATTKERRNLKKLRELMRN